MTPFPSFNTLYERSKINFIQKISRKFFFDKLWVFPTISLMLPRSKRQFLPKYLKETGGANLGNDLLGKLLLYQH